MRIMHRISSLLGISLKNFPISTKRFSSCIILHPKVKQCLQNDEPIVALETAVLTHGMPYPYNLQNAFDTERIIQEEGATAATIGIIDGKIHVGLEEEQITFLAKCNGKNCIKVARRDLPFVLMKKLNGGTTVSATMAICHQVGVPIFVTGGIGGVHRRGETTFDISSDLTELGRTPVAVVSAGVKSILDVGRTLEFLETQGVSVSVLGDSPVFPDFFTRDSGFTAPSFIANTQEAALMILLRSKLQLESGMLIAVPIPEQFAADGRTIKNAIETAVNEAEFQVKGRDVTPFVLKRVNEISQGKSLQTNLALLMNNATIGARIAVEFANMKNKQASSKGSDLNGSPSGSIPVVIGGSIVDVITKITEKTVDKNGRTHHGQMSQSFGGVGRNIADALTRLKSKPLFISAVGQDPYSTSLMNHNSQMNTKGFFKNSEVSTACYNVLLDHKGEVLVGVGDMEIHCSISPQWVQKFSDDLQRAPLVIMDGNIPLETMNIILSKCASANVPGKII